jgi:CRISP-associated protein Cas1
LEVFGLQQVAILAFHLLICNDLRIFSRSTGKTGWNRLYTDSNDHDRKDRIMSTLYISKQGATLRIRAGRFVVTKGDEEFESIPRFSLDAAVLIGYVQVTSQAVHELLESGVPVLYLSPGGQFRGMLQPGYPRNSLRRIAQYDASLDSPFVLRVARELVGSKLAASARSLKKWSRNKWLDNDAGHVLKPFHAAVQQATDAGTLRGVEARAAACYFEVFGQTLPPPFWWDGRNRRPPRDPVNALLSFAYMLAVGEAVSACFCCGLDPYIGFYHVSDYSRPSLALDLIEPLRSPYGDHFIMRLLQRETFQLEDFREHPQNGCRLSPEALRQLLMCWEGQENGYSPRSRIRRHLQRICRRLQAAIQERQTPDFHDLAQTEGKS